MPELPEVETIKRTLHRLVVGQTIERVTVRLPRIIQRPPDPGFFSEMLRGQSIRGVERRGKFLRFILSDLVLVSHLRMEGRYGVYASDDPVEPHTHVLFHFVGGRDLRYRDVRQFGTMHLFEPGEEWAKPPLCKLGLEPLNPEFTFETFRRTIGSRSTRIKPLLLNQEYVAGIGNIYVDEALFRAGIHPESPARSLKPAKMKKLFRAIVDTLTEAVNAGGSSVKSYVNGQGEMGMFQQQLAVYGRQSLPCPACGEPVRKMVVAGRGTHYCERCQPR